MTARGLDGARMVAYAEGRQTPDGGHFFARVQPSGTEDTYRPRRPGSAPAAGEAPLLVEAVVDEPGGAHNVYAYDPRQQAIRLAAVVPGPAAAGVEHGTVSQTRTEAGPLPVLIWSAVPTFPGCRVAVKVLGLLTAGDGRRWAVGVPAADPERAALADVADLTEPVRRLLLAAAGLPDGEAGGVRWAPPAAARPAVRAATEAYWQAKARAESGVRAGAAWKVAPGSALPKDGPDAGPHTWAERLLPRLPLRFQRYVEELLLPEERILLFLARPPFAPPGRLARLRRRRLPEALLLVTDRQVLLMADSLPPDATMVHWGYDAVASAVERVAAATVSVERGTAVLEVALAAARGTQRLRIPFPADEREVLEEAAALLRRFPAPEGCRLPRLYRERPELPHPQSGPDGPGSGVPAGLRDGVPADTVWSAAAARPADGEAAGPAALLTEAGIRLAPGRRRREDPPAVRCYGIEEVASVQLTQSLVGCRFGVAVPRGDRVEEAGLRYDYPDGPAFLRTFVLLRHLLGRPAAPPEQGA